MRRLSFATEVNILIFDQILFLEINFNKIVTFLDFNKSNGTFL